MAKWSMGLLEPSEWKAQWIGAAAEAQPSRADLWFRKNFSLTGKPKRAMVYVASLGYHELYVNGKKIGDRVLTPSISDLSQRARYVTYDIADHLEDGLNTIAFWCAPGWADYTEFKVPNKPLVMAQIEIIQADGQPLRAITNATWKTSRQSALADRRLGISELRRRTLRRGQGDAALERAGIGRFHLGIGGDVSLQRFGSRRKWSSQIAAWKPSIRSKSRRRAGRLPRRYGPKLCRLVRDPLERHARPNSRAAICRTSRASRNV